MSFPSARWLVVASFVCECVVSGWVSVIWASVCVRMGLSVCVWLGVSEWVRVCLVGCEEVDGQLGVVCFVCKLTARIIYFIYVNGLLGCIYALLIM